MESKYALWDCREMREFCFSSRNFEDEYRSLLEVIEGTQSRNDDEISKKGHFSTVPLYAAVLQLLGRCLMRRPFNKLHQT
jgi:hypothetical protein